MKKIFLLVIFCVFATLNTTPISKITSFTNEKQYAEYDIYMGAILQYQDRIITRNYYSIIEYKILNDGMLERVGYHETNPSIPGYSFIDGNKYYFVNMVHFVYGTPFYITVYDLSKTPMEEITTFETNISSAYIPSIFFNEDHLFISDWVTQRVVYYDKNSYTLNGYIDGSEHGLFAGTSIIKDSYLIHSVAYTNGENYIRFYKIIDLYNDELDLVYELELPQVGANILNHMQLQDNFLVASYHSGVIVIDIEDINNPVILHDLLIHVSVASAIYAENYIILTTGNSGMEMQIFQKTSTGEYQKIFYEVGYWPNSRSNILLHDKYLYWSSGDGINVFDISDEGFEQIKSYGVFQSTWSYFYVSDTDIYHLKPQTVSKSFEIYSILSDSLVVEIDFEKEKDITSLQIKDDMLFLVTVQMIDYVRYEYFQIYKIEDQKAKYIQTLDLSTDRCYRFFVNDKNRAFLHFSSDVIKVYDITDNNRFVYVGEFYGKLQASFTNFPKDLILSNYGNTVTLREQDNFENITASGNISMSGKVLWYYGNGYFFTIDNIMGQYSCYQYSLENKNIYLLQNFPQSFETTIYPFNQIISKNAYQTDKSIYYSILNGQIQQIGEKKDNRSVELTYFFPESKKMVQIANSGIWVYDFDYEPYVSDSDAVEIARSTGLIANYPNPFNPVTNILFSISNDGQVGIDIYNIKGQKIKTLVNKKYNKGKHSVVWNGTDDSNVTVASGIYFYRMTTEDFTQTKKMILIK